MSASQAKIRKDLFQEIAREYQDLNGSYIETLCSPSALEFLQAVRVGRPTIIEGLTVPALKKWSDSYLIEKMGNRSVSVSVTPRGDADAIVEYEGLKYFTEPHVETMTLQALLSHLTNSEDSPDVYYLQSQNGNLYSSIKGQSSEFEPLLEDVPNDIPSASEALCMPPDAVNIWIGNDRSVTSIHSDPYENIYLVVRGVKHFTLFPPTEAWRMKEKLYPHARYSRDATTGILQPTPSPSSTEPIRWSSVTNPREPKEVGNDANPIEITLEAGDALYLPAGWWHYVRQSNLTIALNWWYDMEPRGMGWVWQNFVRGPSDDLPSGNTHVES